MKKIFFLLALTLIAYTNSFAQGTQGAQSSTCTNPTATEPCRVTDCSNPSTSFTISSGTGAGTYTCNYSDSPVNGRNSICPYIYNGGTYSKQTINNCRLSSGAPINSGLIFLIIAGAGLGAYIIRKKQQSNLSL